MFFRHESLASGPSPYIPQYENNMMTNQSGSGYRISSGVEATGAIRLNYGPSMHEPFSNRHNVRI